MGVTADHQDLYLLRHGESTSNAQGLFTGILDVPLTPRGITEARNAAELLKSAHAIPTLVYRSALLRTAQTVTAMLPVFAPTMPKVEVEWRLNERNYGALTGQSKSAVADRYGVAQFLAWRRSFSTAPPPMNTEMLTSFAANEPFKSLPSQALTSTESLADVTSRLLPFVQHELLPAIQHRERCLVIAHGNSLRALCMILEGLTPDEVEELAIPTGHPLRYRFDLRAGFPVMTSRTYLDPDAAVTATEILSRQGGT